MLFSFLFIAVLSTVSAWNYKVPSNNKVYYRRNETGLGCGTGNATGCTDDAVIPSTAADAQTWFNDILLEDHDGSVTQCVLPDGTLADECIKFTEDIGEDLGQTTTQMIQDSSYFLALVDVDNSTSSLTVATDLLAQQLGLDLTNTTTETNSSILEAANLPTAVPTPTPSAVPRRKRSLEIANYINRAMTDKAINDPALINSVEGEAAYWRKYAEDKATTALVKSYSTIYTSLQLPVTVVKNIAQPAVCDQITRSTIDTCKKGVRANVAYCKQALRDKIATCKDDARRKIDGCKKSKAWYDATGKAACEATRPALMLKCEIERIDIPLCEIDRLTAACCEATRPQAQALCYSGLAPKEIQKAVQSVQSKCAIATALAKAAVKSYLSGQVIGVLGQLKTVKEIGEGVKIIDNIQSAQKNFNNIAEGVTAAAEGRITDATKYLGKLAAELPKPISSAKAWGDAANALINQKTDELLGAACAAVAELEVVKKAKEAIEELRDISNDINQIKKAANKCGVITNSIMPPSYESFKNVRSEADVEKAVSDYQNWVAASIYKIAKCRSVVTRIERAVEKVVN
ncbi:hypothetical protein MMC30_008465 [Trapelia coarctata]|nr:hypothetical protein [Trapelia coarctata]